MRQFLRQEKGTFIMMLTSTGSILLFYQLSTSFQAEWSYPLILALFFYIVYIVYRYSYYLKYRDILEQGVLGKFDNHMEYPSRYKGLINCINDIHSKYLGEIHKITQENEKNRLLNAQVVHNAKLPVATLKLVLEDNIGSLDTQLMVDLSNEVDKINVHLEQAISLYRMQSFYTDLMVVQLDLYHEVKACINLYKDNFIYHHVYPEWLNKKSIYKVLSDQKWNRVLISQIISNSIKYSAMKGKGLKIKFKIEESEENTNLHIIDEGIGIKDYDLRRVFSPFFTGENGRINGNSSGIGLYIAKEIADRLNHTITLTSIKNEGTKVTIKYLTKK